MEQQAIEAQVFKGDHVALVAEPLGSRQCAAGLCVRSRDCPGRSARTTDPDGHLPGRQQRGSLPQRAFDAATELVINWIRAGVARL